VSRSVLCQTRQSAGQSAGCHLQAVAGELPDSYTGVTHNIKEGGKRACAGCLASHLKGSYETSVIGPS
jgi:hypothetical protein